MHNPRWQFVVLMQSLELMKKGELTLKVLQIAKFCDCILASGLIEAFHTSLKFTWESGELKNIASRFDRALGNTKLFNQMQFLNQEALDEVQYKLDIDPQHEGFNSNFCSIQSLLKEERKKQATNLKQRPKKSGLQREMNVTNFSY